ncbi:glycosyltransferase family 4 protein, partial [Candidatus Microgenomates bacterium]|nr:glycosyltransferase family 4 protein [Candidatus Microgenomates bacterium]
GVDLSKYQVSSIKYQVSKKEKIILFIGDFRWIENRDAATWLLKEIWPELEARSKKLEIRLKLWMVGKAIPNSIKQLANEEDVVFDEEAPDDTREIFARADLLLAPIRVGGGGKFKILESMASGVPVVTTLIGIEGIAAQDNNQVLIGDNIQDLVDKTVEALTKEDLYRKISQRARKLIEEKYDWKIIVKKLENVYQKTIA